MLKSGLHLDYLLATALAVEVTVIHNYLWHERFTWGNRAGDPYWRFVKFNLTAGIFAIMGNLLLMKLLVGWAGMNCLLASVGTIAACSVVNFLLSDRLVFQEP